MFGTVLLALTVCLLSSLWQSSWLIAKVPVVAVEHDEVKATNQNNAIIGIILGNIFDPVFLTQPACRSVST